MKVFLFVVLILAGQQPKTMQTAMPSLEDCFVNQIEVLEKSPLREAVENNGGTLHASCAIVFPPGKPS